MCASCGWVAHAVSTGSSRWRCGLGKGGGPGGGGETLAGCVKERAVGYDGGGVGGRRQACVSESVGRMDQISSRERGTLGSFALLCARSSDLVSSGWLVGEKSLVAGERGASGGGRICHRVVKKEPKNQRKNQRMVLLDARWRVKGRCRRSVNL